MHPVWLCCESSEYPDIPALSRFARRAPQYLKLRTYSLYAAQQGLVAFRLDKLSNQVRLYAVLGGGGEPPKTHQEASADIK